MKRRYRPRKQFKFWLYHDIALEVRLMEYIEFLVKSRRFAETIRNGLRLMWTLAEGDTSVLAELFPGIVASLKVSSTPPPPDTSQLERKIDQLQQAVLAGSVGTGLTMLLPSTGGMKTLAGFDKIAMPTFDDDDDLNTVIIKRDPTAMNSVVENLMRSVQTMADAPVSTSAPIIAAPRQMNKHIGDQH